MESSTPGRIESVPNEILLSILSILPSRSLLPILPVNRRFYSVALRILHTRLSKAASLPDHRLILECYHPSAKISTPYLYCDYLSTDPLPEPQEGDSGEGDQSTGHEGTLPRPTLGDLGQIYSHFRPVVQDENQRPRLRYPRRQQQQQQNGDGGGTGGEDNGGEGSSSRSQDLGETLPTHDVYLDENELFSQLCTITNLVKVGPRSGLFVSHVNVSDGIIRVWRGWLAQQAEAAVTTSGRIEAKTTEVVWADHSQNVGLRFRVTEKDMPRESESDYNYRSPVLMAADEEPPVAYRLELEELAIRANHLLLAMEKSDLQEFATSGFFYEPRGASSPCPAQFFTWVTSFDMQLAAPELEPIVGGPGPLHGGERKVARWVPVQDL